MYLRKLYVIVGWTKDEDESLSTCDGQIYVMLCSRRGGPKCTHEGEVNKRKKAEKKNRLTRKGAGTQGSSQRRRPRQNKTQGKLIRDQSHYESFALDHKYNIL